MGSQILFWHRRDLRLADNLGLAQARERSPQILSVFCLDPQILERDDIAPARVAYMLGCLEVLQERYASVGGHLCILKRPPEQGIVALAQAIQAQAVYWNRDVEPYGRSRDQQVMKSLQAAGIEVQTFWDQLLHDPATIQTGSGKPYTVYTPFWKNCAARSVPDPAPEIDTLEKPNEATLQAAENAGCAALSTAKDLGFQWSQPLIQPPGERAACDRLQTFCRQAICEYDEQRNFPAVEGTALLSAAFKFGAIGIRQAWTEATAIYEQARSDEARQQIRTWQKELVWREFYQHALYHFPALAQGPYRPQWQHFPWENDTTRFQAWCEGQTGYPIVDAAMRQLNETGWMHNRCRMIVASFLTKDLIIDWRWGEKYFMQTLIDGDLAANNGGWQWSASSGMDPKPLRIFNPASQAQKYDPEAAYIRQWLPEARHLDTEPLVTGNILPLERGDYPAPIVDHKQQQKHFKALYKQQT